MTPRFCTRKEEGTPIMITYGETGYYPMRGKYSDADLKKHNDSFENDQIAINVAVACSMGDTWASFDKFYKREVARQKNEVYEKPVCANCGASAENISFEAFVGWDSESHCLTVLDLCDKGHTCSVCDGECKIEWRGVDHAA